MPRGRNLWRVSASSSQWRVRGTCLLNGYEEDGASATRLPRFALRGDAPRGRQGTVTKAIHQEFDETTRGFRIAVTCR